MTSCATTVCFLFTETVTDVRNMFINTMRDATRDIARAVAFQNSPALANNFINLKSPKLHSMMSALQHAEERVLVSDGFATWLEDFAFGRILDIWHEHVGVKKAAGQWSQFVFRVATLLKKWLMEVPQGDDAADDGDEAPHDQKRKEFIGEDERAAGDEEEWKSEPSGQTVQTVQVRGQTVNAAGQTVRTTNQPFGLDAVDYSPLTMDSDVNWHSQLNTADEDWTGVQQFLEAVSEHFGFLFTANAGHTLLKVHAETAGKSHEDKFHVKMLWTFLSPIGEASIGLGKAKTVIDKSIAPLEALNKTLVNSLGVISSTSALGGKWLENLDAAITDNYDCSHPFYQKA